MNRSLRFPISAHDMPVYANCLAKARLVHSSKPCFTKLIFLIRFARAHHLTLVPVPVNRSILNGKYRGMELCDSQGCNGGLRKLLADGLIDFQPYWSFTPGLYDPFYFEFTYPYRFDLSSSQKNTPISNTIMIL